VEESKVAELGNKLLEFQYINKAKGTFPFALRAWTIKHFAEEPDGTAIIADMMGGFVHVTERYDALVERMAEYDRFIEVAAYEFENGQPTEKTSRCSVRASNINWYGAHPERGSTIVDCFGRTLRIATTFDEIKRLLEGM
jgi:hypothetical protein